MSESPPGFAVPPPAGQRPPAMTVRETVAGVAGDLRASGVESPRLEAERLVAYALGTDRGGVARMASTSFPVTHARELAAAVRRRLNGEPLQHIEGEAAFRDLVLGSDRRALVPRPETEQLVDIVVEWTRHPGGKAGVTVVSGARPAGGPSVPPVGTALDIGTGSGAIALALASEGIAADVLAIDRSEDALEQATENAAGVSRGHAVRFVHVRRGMWEAVGSAVFDLITANPPYIPDDDIENLSIEVREHDPTLALAGGPDGLDVVREIVGGAPDHLRSGGALCLELGAGQTPEVVAMLDMADWNSVEVRMDLAGRDRFILAVRS